MHSRAIVAALLDTAAIFYRLRILRYYQRKQRLVGRFGWTRPRQDLPRVALVADPEAVASLDYPSVDVVQGELADVARATNAELLAVVEQGAVPATNWLSATVPFLARPEIGAVVTPALAPAGGDTWARAGAAIRESRIGGGLQYFRFLPGNLRFVDEYATRSIVVRTVLVRTLLAGVDTRNFVAVLADHGIRVLYTPETTIAAHPAPLFRAHLAGVLERGRSRGGAVRARGIKALRTSSLPPLLLGLFAITGWCLLFAGELGRAIWLATWLAYAVVVVGASAVAALRFRSLLVGSLALPGFALTHGVYALGFVQGAVCR